MLFYIIIFLVCMWTFIYTIARLIQYHRIVSNYKDQTTATVIRIRNHTPANKKEPPAVDMLLEYVIDGKEGRSEIVVPADQAEQYEIGKTLEISYYVAGNGAVHIASSGNAPRRLMYGYIAAIVIELIVFAAIWRLII